MGAVVTVVELLELLGVVGVVGGVRSVIHSGISTSVNALRSPLRRWYKAFFSIGSSACAPWSKSTRPQSAPTILSGVSPGCRQPVGSFATGCCSGAGNAMTGAGTARPSRYVSHICNSGNCCIKTSSRKRTRAGGSPAVFSTSVKPSRPSRNAPAVWWSRYTAHHRQRLAGPRTPRGARLRACVARRRRGCSVM